MSELFVKTNDGGSSDPVTRAYEELQGGAKLLDALQQLYEAAYEEGFQDGMHWEELQ